MADERRAAFLVSRRTYEKNRDADRDKLDPPYLTQHTPHVPGAYAGVRTAAWEIHGSGTGLLARAWEQGTVGVCAKEELERRARAGEPTDRYGKPPKARLLAEYMPTRAEAERRLELSEVAPHVRARIADAMAGRKERSIEQAEVDKLLRSIWKPHSNGLVLEPTGAAYERAVGDGRVPSGNASARRRKQLLEENRRLRQILASAGASAPS
ncbi:hypothetical protein KFE25_000998 [Diacronema lutheri]|uniref:Uncharacterized protein n=1 Tax=Diacronema lutheri TaxID=2081491 RepID=A0A8J5XAD9_DIALT|nr:hypothetical protein KFE25_000998 [Diacronema lutheri]